MHTLPDQDVSRAALRSCFVGALAAVFGAALPVGGLFLPDFPEFAPTSAGGASAWERIGPPVPFAACGRFAGPACFGKDVRNDDH
jgi:hypothetical protein